MLPCGYVVGAANAKLLTLYDGWGSLDSDPHVLGEIKSSEPMDGWTWLSNRDRIALLAGNKVTIHDQVLSKDHERYPSFFPSPLLGATAEKWKRLVPLPGGDDGAAFVAVLTEPCLQAHIRAKTEEGRGLNETLEALRAVQVQQKTTNEMKMNGREDEGAIAEDERDEEEEHAYSSSSGSSSDALVDLCGRIGGGGGVLTSSSLLDTLMGGITCPPGCTGLFLPAASTAQQSNDDGGAKLLLLKVPVVSSMGPQGEQEVLRSIPVGRNVCAMHGLLAASETHVAIGDALSSTLLVHRLSDNFPAVTSTKEQQFPLPAGLVPRGLRFFGDHTLVCLAVEAAGAEGGSRGRGREKKEGEGGGGTLQGSTSASLIEFSLEKEEPPEESEGLSTVVGNGVGLSAGSSHHHHQQQKEQQQDVMSFLRSFRDEMRERFDKLEGRMKTLELRLGEL